MLADEDEVSSDRRSPEALHCSMKGPWANCRLRLSWRSRRQRPLRDRLALLAGLYWRANGSAIRRRPCPMPCHLGQKGESNLANIELSMWTLVDVIATRVAHPRISCTRSRFKRLKYGAFRKIVRAEIDLFRKSSTRLLESIVIPLAEDLVAAA